ncbi:23S rRNA pseudouridine1911/1915/1917 synthase [Tumebacillus sp. BK434]|uniref:RluA family pseudouridine synthase n=1 Tax=Tumebacillus sp. BK434 TaxID=2512169 RepID=UPI00104F81B8|nr:RluA family pseudouridine synthase [Tumebacillus sp. BK434]TCP54781.1 23S rRNA pseudouridine1911/1915/1917 synthase [Tumebacillus sp. BK434]
MSIEKNGPWLELRVTKKQEGSTVGDLLLAEAGLPEKAALELMHKRAVLLGKEPAALEAVVKAGDRVRCVMFPEEPYGVDMSYDLLDVLYEDDHLLVVNKPAGMKVHPNEPGESDTLLGALAFHYQMQGLETRCRVLHRLDQETSGAVMFPKHEIAHRLLDAMLTERKISREYHALVTGVVAANKGLIDQPIGRDRSHPTRRRVSKTGKPAQTEYRVLERFADVTLLKAKLHTGRTHQIRVHLAWLGHPLLGDELYFGPTERIGRQALHARYLRFPHPITGQLVEAEAPYPDDFAELLQSLQPHL